MFGGLVDNYQLCTMTGKELKELRIKAGLTQAELAEKIGSHKAVISRWENGKGNISLAYQKLLEITLKDSK